MGTLYDIETRTFVLSRSMHVRRHAVHILRDGKTLKTIEGDNDPFRIPISTAGLLAVGEKSTQSWNLRARKMMKPVTEIEGHWIFGTGTDLLFSIRRTPSGSGLFARTVEESEPRPVCEGLKGNPAGLYPGADWWFFADGKNKQCIFGQAGAIVSKVPWNTGVLGDFPVAFAVDFPGKRVFTRHEFYRFGCISRLSMGDPKIAAYKTECEVLSLPAARGGRWAKELPEDLPGSFLGHLQDRADAQWASKGDVLHFGIHGLFRLREHEFIALIPDWPAVRCEDEYECALLAVLDAKDRRFDRFLEPDTGTDAREAWEIPTGPWPAFPPEPRALCGKSSRTHSGRITGSIPTSRRWPRGPWRTSTRSTSRPRGKRKAGAMRAWRSL